MQTDSIEIRKMAYKEIDTAFILIWNVFQEFVAPDYSQEGIDSFYNGFIRGDGFRTKFAEGKETMFGAFTGGRLTGVLSLSVNNTVSCLFVDGNYHRKGIGRKLFHTVIRELRARGAAELTLNASPYAMPFYHAMGFCDMGEMASYKGIIYTPMKLILRP